MTIELKSVEPPPYPPIENILSPITVRPFVRMISLRKEQVPNEFDPGVINIIIMYNNNINN